MHRILHILTQPEDPFALRLIQLEAQQPDCQIESLSLDSPNLNYDALLDRIFDADSVQVW